MNQISLIPFFNLTPFKGRLLFSLLVWVLLVGIANAASSVVPINYFVGDSEVVHVRLSPDGRKLAFVKSNNKYSAVLVMNLANKKIKPIQKLEVETGKFINDLRWKGNKYLLVEVRSPMTVRQRRKDITIGGGPKASYFVSINIDTLEAITLFRPKEKQRDRWAVSIHTARIFSFLDNDEHHIQLYESGEGKKLHTIDIRNGERSGTVEFNNYEHLIGTTVDGKTLLISNDRFKTRRFFLVKNKKRRSLKHFLPDGDWRIVGLNFDASKLFIVKDYQGRNALFSFSTEDEKADSELIFGDSRYDVGNDLVYSRAKKKYVGIQSITEKIGYFYWDENRKNVAKHFDKLIKLSHNSIISASKDEKRFIIYSQDPSNSGAYYLYDTESQQHSFIAYVQPKLSKNLELTFETFEFSSRDDISLNGYVVRPANFTGPLQTIVYPHGGPEDRSVLGFHFLTSFLASRGYAVISVDFRGSTGYGEKFRELGHKEWGLSIQHDITDSVRYAVNAGITDPDHVCIVGWSFGGYSALMGAINNEAGYRCAVSIAGVSDLVKLGKRSKYLKKIMGGKFAGGGVKKLRQESPRHFANMVEIPVLLLHGEMDTIANVSHSEIMHKALLKHEKKSELVIYDRDNHGLTKPGSRKDLLERLEKFLEQNI